MSGRLTLEERGALERIAAGGWDSLEEAEAVKQRIEARQADAAAERRAKERHMVRAALGTPEGQALLAWLKANTFELPPQADELEAATAEAYALAMKRREGQASIVFKLIEMLAPDEDAETKETRT